MLIFDNLGMRPNNQLSFPTITFPTINIVMHIAIETSFYCVCGRKVALSEAWATEQGQSLK